MSGELLMPEFAEEERQLLLRMWKVPRPEAVRLYPSLDLLKKARQEVESGQPANLTPTEKSEFIDLLDIQRKELAETDDGYPMVMVLKKLINYIDPEVVNMPGKTDFSR